MSFSWQKQDVLVAPKTPRLVLPEALPEALPEVLPEVSPPNSKRRLQGQAR